ncbi:hypothetical protein NKR23_g3923 [Pleurostoma richardsiae]|uniref:Myb-like DNA-binding domain-containing protein n=1 Tax=Pleurostoma richardsiae TaxID=41990 RepID=A0AA38VSL3_9PEZI|nr:hypothetical protein NKR23_g3923 [Pleurostoma richardsiae]
MSSNNDNAMTRFLFAILRQKCLKDIDWNKVAHDPVLAQEITNGHAARMRYSRFRSAMLGLEPQRRNRTNPNKSKVTKNKKEAKAKKEEPVKSEAVCEEASVRHPVKHELSPRIKHETSQLPVPVEPQSGPALISPVIIADQQMQLHARLLTPCSDSDILAASQGYGTGPASEMLRSEASFDFAGAAACRHEHVSWHPNPAYSPFGVPYELEGYGPAFCDHQHDQHDHHNEQYAIPPAIIGTDPTHVPVKHEDWDSQYQ